MQQKFTYLFIFLLIASAGSISLAQNAPVDFEEGGNGATWTWTTFANAPDDPIGIVPNPDMTGLNTSSTVGMFTALLTGDPWAGFFSDGIGEFTFDETNSTVKIMVHKPVISNFGVKFEGAGVDPIEILVPNTVTNEWEELTFDFTSKIGVTFNRLVFLADFGPDPRAQDNTLYMDNLTFSEGIAAADVNVTFQVDMNVQIAKGNFDPASEVVTIPGDFLNWLNEPPANTEKTMDDADEDGIYTKTIAMAPNATYQYKYNIGLGWDGKDETTGNRSIDIGGSDMIVAVQWFNMEVATGIPTTIEFQVDMQGPESTGAFDRTQNNVFVAGSFTDWGTGALIMTDDDNDSVFTVTVNDTSLKTLFFKFVWAPGDTIGANGSTWEDDPNREYVVLDTGNVFFDYWNRIDPTTTTADGNITFNVDMSVMTEVGIFDPDNDAVQVRGGFNGWGDNDPTVSHMNQDFLDPNQWFLQVPFVGAPVGADQLFKYFVAIDSAANPAKFDLWTDGWERPFIKGGGNRPAAFEGTSDQNLDPVFYDGVQPSYVITEAGVEITFSIDMTVAADADQQVPTFNSATDTVWWVSEQPAFAYSQGWEDTDHMKVLALTDDNSDMVYEGTLTVTAPSWNGFEYIYGFSNGGDLTREEAGFGNFAHRVRYIEQNGYRSFVQPYSAPTDSWFLSENKESEWEAAPAGDITGIQDLGLVANEFSLDQNYPNPFNPATQIRFSIPSADVVTLKIYSLLGQEVKTLINEDMKAGSYEIDFNASNLATGLYFYTLTSGNFVSTKKMMLLK